MRSSTCPLEPFRRVLIDPNRTQGTFSSNHDNVSVSEEHHPIDCPMSMPQDFNQRDQLSRQPGAITHEDFPATTRVVTVFTMADNQSTSTHQQCHISRVPA